MSLCLWRANILEPTSKQVVLLNAAGFSLAYILPRSLSSSSSSTIPLSVFLSLAFSPLYRLSTCGSYNIQNTEWEYNSTRTRLLLLQI